MDIIKNLFSFIFNFYMLVFFLSLSLYLICSLLSSSRLSRICFFLILSLSFTCSLLSSSKLSHYFLFPFFHNFLTIPFHEYQGCRFFSLLLLTLFNSLFYSHQGYHTFVSLLFYDFLSLVLFYHHQGYHATFSFLFFINI